MSPATVLKFSVRAAGAIAAAVLAASPAVAAQDVLIRGAKVYSVSARGTLDNADVLVHAGRIAAVTAAGSDTGPVPAGTEVVEGPAPVLDETEARERLELSGEPFVFYRDRDSGRGRVLYLRYDGHYGIIEAA